MAETSREVIENYLIEKGLEYRETNGQFLLKKSPVTWEAKWHHFYINAETWLRDDKKAGKSGNFDQLRAYYWDSPVQLPEATGTSVKVKKEHLVMDFNKVKEAEYQLRKFETKHQEYLMKQRGLEEKTIKHFHLGIEKGNITIPLFDNKNTLVGIRKRQDPYNPSDMPRYFVEKWTKAILFNEIILDKNPREVYLTEGEFDAMLLHQKGLTNVLSITLGAGYFSDERVDKLKDVKKIFLCYDNDDAWQEGMLKASEKLGKSRCRVVQIPKTPGKKKVDITDYFMWGATRDDFLKLVKEAKTPTVIDKEAVKHISDFNDELRDKLLSGDYKWVATWYEKLDEIIGGYRKGRVIVLSWLTSTGKTTFSQNLCLSMAYRKLPVMFISMEMPPIDICKKFLMMHKKIKWADLDDLKPTSPEMKLVDEWLMQFKGTGKGDDMPIYLMNKQGEVSLQIVEDISRMAKESYNCQLLVIDHLHYFGSDSKNRTSEIAAITRKVKNMAMELDIPILLLAHLNRWGRQKQRTGLYIPSLSDLRDSWAIEQDADQVVFVCRDSEAVDADEKRKAVIKVAKNRDGKTWHVSMDMDLDIGYFSEMATEDYLNWWLKTKEVVEVEEVDLSI